VNIALTGTPGTGKTTLSKKLNYNIVSINQSYPEISDGKNENGDWLINLDKLLDNIEVAQYNNTVFEGHVSHFLENLDLIIVLRCQPSKLQERLEERNYNQEKIRENIEAEALNIISEEAIDSYGEEKVFELDTSSSDLDESVNLLNDIINGNIKSNKRIDYSETIMDWY
jgi:adenylate kinase